MSTQRERNLALVNRYIASGESWPAEPRSIAVWALNKKLWQPRLEDLLKEAARDFSDAMRNEYITDPQGRQVRVKHAARVKRDGRQTTLWGDWNSSAQFMQVSFAQRRRLVVGECNQLKMDVDSYNENANQESQLEMSFNFEPDLAEKAAVREFERAKEAASAAGV
ncbi:MAG: hypothetical protein IIC80_06130 [Chloroflexi bacterium]|nr:hypothetical protein [Chloroflexota bacterium]